MDMGIISMQPPASAFDWYALLQANPFLGLLLLDLFDIVNYVLVSLIFLALYGALRRANKAAMTVATAFALVGVAVSLASNQAFALLTLSDQHAAASTDVMRTLFLAAGEALLASHKPSGIHLGLLFVALAGLIASVVMLRSRVFGRATAIFGVVANSLVLAYYVALPLVPSIAFLFPAASAPFRLLWYILIALRLFQLGRGAPEVLE
jgi:hypothetical protein